MFPDFESLPVVQTKDDTLSRDYKEAGGPFFARVPSGEFFLVMSEEDYKNIDSWRDEALESLRGYFEKADKRPTVSMWHN